jgi:copper oxidase (laccase) domain-containing protein
VIDAMRERFGVAAAPALAAGRAGHAQLDLVRLAGEALRTAGVPAASIGSVGACTHCDPERFHSFRRDGAGAGRLLSWIQVSGGSDT